MAPESLANVAKSVGALFQSNSSPSSSSKGFQRSKTSGHCVMIRTPSPLSAQSSRYGDFAKRMESIIPSLSPSPIAHHRHQVILPRMILVISL
jgi:hypothetical protein